MSRLLKYTLLIAALAVVGTFLVACGCDSETTTTAAPTTTMMPETTTTAPSATTGTLMDVINNTPELSTLAAAIKIAGLESTLSDPTAELTVFAPSNDAFAAALASSGLTPDQLLASADLELVLKNHVLAGMYDTVAIYAGNQEQIVIDSIAGFPLTIVVGDTGNILVGDNSANVTTADILATNGVIHIIDGVLVPSSVQL